jgi:hypothetical protein
VSRLWRLRIEHARRERERREGRPLVYRPDADTIKTELPDHWLPSPDDLWLLNRMMLDLDHLARKLRIHLAPGLRNTHRDFATSCYNAAGHTSALANTIANLLAEGDRIRQEGFTARVDNEASA